MSGLPSLESFFSQLRACTCLIRGPDYTQENLNCLSRHLKCLFHVIITERPPDVQPPFASFSESPDTTEPHQPFGPILVAFTKSSFLQQLVAWVDPAKVPPDIRNFLLRLILHHLDILVSQAKQDVLNCPEVLRPILQLLGYTRHVKDVQFMQELSILLKSLCVLLCRDPSVLKNSKKVSAECTNDKYFIFSQLVPLLHLQGQAGDNVRDALLLILALSVRDPDVAQYLTSGSDLCPVLGTGLSGLYSSLPKNLTVSSRGPPSGAPSSKEIHVPGAGWHRLTKHEWSSCEPLAKFLNTLDFCDLAVRKASLPVRKQILFYIYSGFLLPVLGSALHQDSLDEVVAATAYLELFLRRLTEPALIGVFLRFIVTAEFDSQSVLSTLISRLSSNPTISMVTLSLFRTILSLNCEDAMYRLVFQYVNNVEFEYVRHSETTSGSATSSEDWFLSAARFLSLTSWSRPADLPSAGQNKSKLQSTGAGVVTGTSLTPSLKEAYSRIIGKATGTSCWTCDYSYRLAELDSPKFPWAAANASESAAPLPDGRLHLENSLFATKPPIRRAAEDKILDKYNLGKSESSLYQLSYLDSSSEEEDELASSHPSTAATVTSRKPALSSEDTTEAFSSPDISAGSLSSPNRIPHSLFAMQLAEIRTLLAEDASGDQDSRVSDFIRILQNSAPATIPATTTVIGAAALPYPPVDPFFMQLLESQLTMETSCVTAVASSTLNETDEQEGALMEAAPSVLSPDDTTAELEDPQGLLDLSLASVGRNSGGGLGPFLSALLGRLDCMNKNCLYTNLLLTDVLLTLVSYPQSPLAEFLLNNSVIQLKPPARSLFQVLTGVRKKIQEAAAKLANWKDLVEDAQDYLRNFEMDASPVGRRSPIVQHSLNKGCTTPLAVSEDDLLVISHFTNAPTPQSTDGHTPVYGRPPASLRPPAMHQVSSPNVRPSPSPPAVGRPSRLLEPVVPAATVDYRLPSPQTPLRKRHSSFGRLSHLLQLSSPVSSPQTSRRSTSVGPTIGSETRNVVYAFIVLQEFCLELASVCCEQGVFYGQALPKLERTLSLENCLANI